MTPIQCPQLVYARVEHPQEFVDGILVDAGMVTLLGRCWARGWATVASCQGGVRVHGSTTFRQGKIFRSEETRPYDAYIVFELPTQLAAFASRVGLTKHDSNWRPLANNSNGVVARFPARLVDRFGAALEVP